MSCCNLYCYGFSTGLRYSAMSMIFGAVDMSLYILVLTSISSWSTLIYNSSIRHEWHECDTSDTNVTRCNTSDMIETRATQVVHDCDTSATRTTRVRHEWKILILIAARVKTYFYILIFTIWQVKGYKGKSNFILRTTFWKCLVFIPKCG